MALKKGMFESYIKERETVVVNNPITKVGNSVYSSNRVFDEPESLKKLTQTKNNSSKNLKAYSSESLASDGTSQRLEKDHKTKLDTN